MSWIVAIALFAVLTAGVFLTLSRNVLRCVIGVSIVGSAANLLLFASGRLGGSAPPIIVEGTRLDAAAANPLPQALVLTAIVITFALTCFSVVLALVIRQRSGLNDTDALRDAEPPLDARGDPGVIDGD